MQKELVSNNSVMTKYVGNQKMLTDCWESDGEAGGEEEQKGLWRRGLTEVWKRSTSLCRRDCKFFLLLIILLGKINMHVINSWLYFNVVASSASEHSDE